MTYLKITWHWLVYSWEPTIRPILITITVVVGLIFLFTMIGEYASESQERVNADRRGLTQECLSERKVYYCRALLKDWYVK